MYRLGIELDLSLISHEKSLNILVDVLVAQLKGDGVEEYGIMGDLATDSVKEKE